MTAGHRPRAGDLRPKRLQRRRFRARSAPIVLVKERLRPLNDRWIAAAEGWERFLTFAHEAEALTRSEVEVYRARLWNALIEVAHRQLEHLQEANPVDRFLGLLRSAISTGHAHLATRDGTAPADPGTCGWLTLRPRNHRRAEWLPQGARVGWLDGQDLLLDIDSAFHVAQTMAAEGDGIVVGSRPWSSACTKAGG